MKESPVAESEYHAYAAVETRAMFLYHEKKNLTSFSRQVHNAIEMRRRVGTFRDVVLRHARETHNSPGPSHSPGTMALAVKTAVRVNQMILMLFTVGASRSMLRAGRSLLVLVVDIFRVGRVRPAS